MHDDEAVNLLRAHGARVDGRRVFIDEGAVQAALAATPSGFTLAGRSPARDVRFGDGHTVHGSCSGPAYVLEGGRVRPGCAPSARSSRRSRRAASGAGHLRCRARRYRGRGRPRRSSCAAAGRYWDRPSKALTFLHLQLLLAVRNDTDLAVRSARALSRIRLAGDSRRRRTSFPCALERGRACVPTWNATPIAESRKRGGLSDGSRPLRSERICALWKSSCSSCGCFREEHTKKFAPGAPTRAPRKSPCRP